MRKDKIVRLVTAAKHAVVEMRRTITKHGLRPNQTSTMSIVELENAIEDIEEEPNE